MLPALCPPLQIVDEKMLVYINDLLASGEIPDLFAQVRMPACSIHMEPLMRHDGAVVVCALPACGAWVPGQP